MLKDLVPQFAETVKNHPTILDNYELKDGIYIKLSLDQEPAFTDDDFLVITKNNKNPLSSSKLLRWFKKVDSLSSVLNDDMNKAVDSKKQIHNTNYLSFFMKKDKLLGADSKLETSTVKKQLQVFWNESLPKSEKRLFELYPIKAKLKKDRQNQAAKRDEFFQHYYSDLIDYMSSSERNTKQKMIYQFWDDHFDTVIEKVRELVNIHKITNYVKFYFDSPIEEYQKEYKIYILSRIFNVNDYNELVDGEIIGLPLYDVSMNAKKPYLELKTMKTKVPTRVTLKEAVTIKDLYQWLQNQGKFKEIILPFHELFGTGTGNEKKRNVAKGAYYLSLDKNGGIQYFDNTPFQQKSNWTLEIANILDIQEKHDDIWIIKSYPSISGKSQLRSEINRLFFGNYMPDNLLDTDTPKAKENVFTTEMVSIYVMVRQALFDFLVKDMNETIRPFIEKYSLQLIENQLLKTTTGLNFKKVADAFQLRLALFKEIEDKEGQNMADQIKNVYQGLKDKLSVKDELIVCDNDHEFFFLAGQVGYYLLSQSKAAKENRTYGIAEPILRAKNPQVLKNKLADLFDTYKHAIKYEYAAFNNALAMVLGYETNAKLTGINKNMLLAGMLANNLFYQKTKTNSQTTNEEVEGK